MSKFDRRWLQQKVKTGHLIVWDSIVNLFEAIDGVYRAQTLCGRSKVICGDNFLPSPQVVTRQAIKGWICGPNIITIDPALKKQCLSLRDSLASGAILPTHTGVDVVIVQPLRKTQRNFKDDLDAVRSTLTTELRRNNKQNRESVVEYIIRQPRWKKRALGNLMKHHHVGCLLTAFVSFCRPSIPFIQKLLRMYQLQIKNFLVDDRPAQLSDFIDFETAPYIASNHISYFITDNKRDFQKALAADAELGTKIKTITQLRNLFP
jgi:hypothetical protein